MRNHQTIVRATFGSLLFCLLLIGGCVADIAGAEKKTSSSRSASTTQRSYDERENRSTESQSIGGKSFLSVWETSFNLSDNGLTVVTRDTSNADSKPRVYTIDRSNRVDKGRSTTQQSEQSDEDSDVGPKFHGWLSDSSEISVDNLKLKNLEKQGPMKLTASIIVILLGIGMIVAPIPFKHEKLGFIMIGIGVFILMANGPILFLAFGLAVLVLIWPWIKGGRVILENAKARKSWGSDMTLDEKREYDREYEAKQSPSTTVLMKEVAAKLPEVP